MAKEDLLVCQNGDMKCNNYCTFHKFNQYSFIEVGLIPNGNEESGPEPEYSVLQYKKGRQDKFPYTLRKKFQPEVSQLSQNSFCHF